MSNFTAAEVRNRRQRLHKRGSKYEAESNYERFLHNG